MQIPLIAAAAAALFLSAQSAPPAPATSTPEAQRAFRSAVGALLRADGVESRSQLNAIPEESLAEAARGRRACMLSLLADGSPAPVGADPLVEHILAAYREYWRRSVLDPAAREAERARLTGRIAAILGEGAMDWERLAPLVRERLAADGVHAINGQTGLLLDLIAWRQQTEREEAILLPEGETRTRVFYLDGFVSRGWGNYLTCEASGTGGWATEEGLYVIVPAYDSLTDEYFRVSYLAHESQHFADYRRFPGLQGWELEYRAKLTELALAGASREAILARFESSRANDPADAHSYANGKVLSDLRERLGLAPDTALDNVPLAQFQQAAAALLRADSERREQARASSPP